MLFEDVGWMVIWGRPSLPPLVLPIPTSRRSSSRRSSTSTSSCTSMSLSCITVEPPFLQAEAQCERYGDLFTAILCESWWSVALKTNSLKAQQGSQFHLAPGSDKSFSLCDWIFRINFRFITVTLHRRDLTRLFHLTFEPSLVLSDWKESLEAG